MKLKILTVIIVAVIVGGVWLHYSNKKSAWNATFEWTGIPALPSWARNKQLEVQGSAFTRTLVVTFYGTSEQIQDWFKNEPALQNVKIERINEQTDKYILKPRGGSAYDEVRVDWFNKKVTITAEWS